MTNDDMTALEDWAEPLLQQLEPSNRRKLMRQVGIQLAKSQRDRIRAQKNPDGSRYKPRKERREIKKPISFQYVKPGSEGRVASMVSFRDEGDRMIGYDREARGLRTFLKRRIEYYMRPRHTAGAIRSQRGSIRRAAMFTKIRQAKYLRVQQWDEGSATVGFVSGVARFASVHQFGKRVPVEPGGPMADYPERRLLGLSARDHEMIRDSLIDALTPRK